MDFSNCNFLFIFLPASLILYFIMPRKIKKYYLTAISIIYFSLASISSLPILIGSIIFNFIFGLLIGKAKKKKIFLIIGIIGNIGLLFVYKYLDFIITNINGLTHSKIGLLDLVLPLGISFFTFQNISYIVDVYKGKIKPEKNVFNLALYTSYFPRIVNGPIVRYDSFINEVNNLNRPNIDNLFNGIKRFSFGLGKVLIVSFVLGNIWTQIIDAMNSFGITTPTAWYGIICYSLFLFINFSGYIDISIGISKMIGITLPENFDHPYCSFSISEFWRRWHITLGAWFRDYIYIPMGGSRKGNIYIHLMIVFLLTGIWHGSSWNFIIWGVYNGIFIVIERLIRDKNFYKRIPKIIKIFITYFIILLGWVLFANNGLAASMVYYKYMFGLKVASNAQYTFKYFLSIYNLFYVIAGFIIALPVTKIITNKIKNKKIIEIVSGVSAIIILAVSIVFLINSSYSPSLYAQF